VARADLTDALRGGLLGVAVGEALGLPWVGRAPREIKRDRLLDGVGPTGTVTAAVLTASGGDSPQTVAAGGQSPIRRAVGTVPDSSRRGDCPPLAVALAVGWREADPRARRAAALPLGFSAVVVADLASAALEGRPLHHLVTDHAEDWTPPFHGVAHDDRAVVDALMAVLYRHDDPGEGLRAAVRLGGGGVALLTALVGGILGGRRPTAIARVPWLARTAVPGEALLAPVVAALAARRQV
jgi:hypothetical protein